MTREVVAVDREKRDILSGKFVRPGSGRSGHEYMALNLLITLLLYSTKCCFDVIFTKYLPGKE